MGFEVNFGEGLQNRPRSARQVASSFQVSRQCLGLVHRPGLEGSDELCLTHQAVLKSEQPEEQIAIGGHGSLPELSLAGRRACSIVARPASSGIGPFYRHRLFGRYRQQSRCDERLVGVVFILVGKLFARENLVLLRQELIQRRTLRESDCPLASLGERN